jgi:micrococcal nuclease
MTPTNTLEDSSAVQAARRGAAPLLLAGALLAAAAAAAAPAAANEPAFILGPVTKVIDGQTIAVGGVALRVEGVHTPKPGDIYGYTAKVYTERRVRGLELRCELLEESAGGYPIGRCLNGGKELGALIIEAGAARDCPRQSGGRFASLESAEARELIPLPPECR